MIRRWFFQQAPDKLIPVILVEVKSSDREVSKSLKYLKAKFPEAEAFQVSARRRKDYISADGIRVLPALKFLTDLV